MCPNNLGGFGTSTIVDYQDYRRSFERVTFDGRIRVSIFSRFQGVAFTKTILRSSVLKRLTLDCSDEGCKDEEYVKIKNYLRLFLLPVPINIRDSSFNSTII